jgi:acrylyl-CoA reductase (NADPH)
VGSAAIAILSNLGYRVVASTGRATLHDYLRELGAHSFLDREELAGQKKPLESERWAGAVDSVGGTTLANLLASMAYGGSVAACGLAGGSDLPATVFPFILRGVNLLGIDSVQCPPERRRTAWQRVLRDLSGEKLENMMQTVPLESLLSLGDEILKGQVRGRVVVDVNG